MFLRPFAIFAALAALVTGEEALLPKHVSMLTKAPMAVKNGSAGTVSKNGNSVIVDLPLDGGWYKFFFGQAGNETAYTFSAISTDWVQISITDAFCAGDSFDVIKDDEYLITTPRVPGDGCKKWTDNPDVAFTNPLWSSTKFSLEGSFNITLAVRDSPFQGGAAFIRADSRLATCKGSIAPFLLVTAPLVPRDHSAAVCARVNGVPAHLTPANTASAIASLQACGGPQQAWFGKLSLGQAAKANELGCLALSTVVPDDPTVDIVDCQAYLPVLCDTSAA
jgi:hypothetical protein